MDNDANHQTDEIEPGYPHHPEFYASRPDTDPEKLWMINRGAEYEDGRYVPGTFTPPAGRSGS